MSKIEEKQRFDEAAALQRAKLHSEVHQFDGAAKQYVRAHGWLEPIKDFTKRRTEAGITTPFKYFTLPGPNMTDIGLLWNAGLIEPINGKLNMAICDREYAYLVVTQIGQLGVEFLAYSDLVLHEALKGKKSTLREHFPFDVINFDLCNALVTGTRKYGNLEALQWILRFQRGQRFLLLLTTRANEKFDDDLVKLLLHNYEREPDFKAAYDAISQQMKQEPLKDSTLFSRIVFPNLIAKYAVRFGYKVIEHFAAYYSRPMDNERHYDMLAHTFELIPLKEAGERETFLSCFEKVPENAHQEQTRILLAKEEKDKVISEYYNFVNSLPTKRFINVDQLLNENPVLLATMQDEEEALLGWWKKT
ncbi:MAG: hypothetical protein ACPGWR_24745 [Ardenticatenaceae bacterium]